MSNTFDNLKEDKITNELLNQLQSFQKSTNLSDKSIKFMYDDPKGKITQQEIPLEDTIPDVPENQAAREFLKNAPSKGLWLPLGKEVKIMMCWRCKSYGHRTGDRECPLAISDAQRQAVEDPMSLFVAKKTQSKSSKNERKRQLESLIAEIRSENNSKHKKHRKKEKTKKESKKKK